ncbi:cytochrome c-type biogenesis protein CcmH [soil metagenome]
MRDAMTRFATGMAIAACLLATPPALARDAAPLDADPALEARVMAVAEELRCLVCQNETIAASHADLAVDLRKQIRTQLAQGRSEAQILDYMVARYGEFVRYRPAFNAMTALLWAGPFVLLAMAIGAWWLQMRKRPREALPAELSEAEAARLQHLFGDGARP